jgi:hypothetical protein
MGTDLESKSIAFLAALVTSRKPQDLPAFGETFTKVFAHRSA